jgi:hypothetical protein
VREKIVIITKKTHYTSLKEEKMSQLSIQSDLVEDKIQASLVHRVASIIDYFIKNESLLEDLNRDEMVAYLMKLLSQNFSSSELEMMSDENLTQKIRQVLGVQAMAGMLKDLTAEQMAEFDAVIASFRQKY